MKRIFFLLIIIFAISKLYGQINTDLKKYYSEKVGFITDSVINDNKLFLDTLYLSFDSTYNSLISEYDIYYRDSICKPLKDSINSFRLDSLNAMSGFFKSRIKALCTAFKDSLKPFFTGFESTAEKSRQEYAACEDCEEIKKQIIMTSLMNIPMCLTKVLSSEFQDNISEYYDTLESALSDSVDVYTDSLYNYSEILLEHQYAEDELNDSLDNDSDEAADYSKLILDINYYNHNTYRGRDFGYYINYLAPVLTYEHPGRIGSFVSILYNL